jgi:aspartyl-tRNA(Asn)/glutamyl-tRNA(Gln) amidotransferase subunit B
MIFNKSKKPEKDEEKDYNKISIFADISNEKDLEVFVEKVIEENPAVVTEFKNGKESVLQFLVGKCMALSKGKANPKVIQELLRKKLS